MLLVAAGLLIAAPFLTFRGVGTGEAYNYSLAVADGVTQFRAGIFPVLVGQTPYAFNGRVHPLRSAPYLVYLAGAIDVLTGRSLGFPALQNLSLAFSLVGSLFGAYGALRWGTRCPPWPAIFLACVYGSSAALLAAAYAFDLFMTVHAAPFVPLALAAAARPATDPRIRHDFALAAALAACWWAHPPVALWLTMSAGAVRVATWAGRPSGRGAAGLAVAALFGLMLAGFPFVSTYEITHFRTFFDSGSRAGTSFVTLVLAEVRHAFVGSVSPVSRSAGSLGDFQMGYVAWALLGAIVVILRRPGPLAGRRLAATALAAMAGLLIALCIPVPYFTGWAWNRLPGVFYVLTNDWPMQRLYLIAVSAVILASGLVVAPLAATTWRRRPITLGALLLVALGWMAWETAPFIARGLRDRWSKEVTAHNYLPANINLTVTSYTFIGVSPTFIHGVMEPWAEFRLLSRQGSLPAGGNYEAGLATGRVAQQGSFDLQGRPGTGPALYLPTLKLEPHRRYLLNLRWRTGPFAGVINLKGPSLERLYILPEAGAAQGFGIGPGHRSALALSTSQETPEAVQLRMLNPTGKPQDLPPAHLADFQLLAIDDGKLPVRVDSWLPLRADVTAPSAECYVETPRRFIPGYRGVVNGRRVIPVASPSGDLMLPVPEGLSHIEVRFVGTPLLRWAFWVSFGSWAGIAGAVGLAGLSSLRGGRRRSVAARPAVRRRRWVRGWRWFGAGALVMAGLWIAGAGLMPRDRAPGTAGPIKLRLLLPKGLTNRQQPLLVSGHRGAGNIVFLKYLDDVHLQVGVDIWGFVRLSAPIAVDYNQEQELVVSGGMLYPAADPLLRRLSPFENARLRRELRVELNGHAVLLEGRPTYDSAPEDISIGVSHIGGSTIQPRFQGQILQVTRLPVPIRVVRTSRPLTLHFIPPINHEGWTEPLLTAWPGGGPPDLFFITYRGAAQVSLGYARNDRPDIVGQPITLRPGRSHTIEWLTHGSDLTLSIDGQLALVVPGRGLPAGRIELARLGLNQTTLASVRDRFTGSQLAPTGASGPLGPLPSVPNGPFRLAVLLPQGRTGQAEPLVVTGKTAKGDLVYVKYVDATHVQFGYDHWGVGGGISGPIAIDYSQPHEIEVGLGSLYAESKDAGWMSLPPDVRKRLHDQVAVRIDGNAVWQAQSPAYPSTHDDIRVGENRIGASSCGPRFTGEILAVARADP